MRLLPPKSRVLRDLNDPISRGMEPKSLLVTRAKVVKFFKFLIDKGIEPLRLLNPK